MRLTEFWQRLDDVLGKGYAGYWADSQVLPELGGRTVQQALSAGEEAGVVWRAVFENLNLPPQHR